MDESRKTQLFVELYTIALRTAYNNPWLQAPRVGSEKWKQLEAARKIVEEMKGEYGDYIRVQFAALKRVGAVPSPSHMVSTKAVDRYMIHQKMKNKYHHREYSIDGNEFVVHSTQKRYPVSQADASIYDDSEANYAHYISKEENLPKDIQKAWEAVEYAIAKLRYKDKTPTDALLRLRSRLQEINNGNTKR